MREKKVFSKGAGLILSSNKAVVVLLLVWVLMGGGIVYGEGIELQSSGSGVIMKIPGGETFLEPMWKCNPETGEMFITFRRQALDESICKPEKVYSEENSIMVVTSIKDSFYVNLKILTFPYQKANLYYDLSVRGYVVEIVRQETIFPVSEVPAVPPSPGVSKSSVFVANMKVVSRTMFFLSVVVFVIGLVYVFSKRVGRLASGARESFSVSKRLNRSRKSGAKFPDKVLKEKKIEKMGEELSYDELKILMKLKSRKIDVRA